MSGERYICFSDTFSLSNALSQNAPLNIGATTSMGEVSPEVKNKLEGLSKDKVSLLKDLETLSRNANALVGGLFESRSGTLKQRWARDPATHEYMRLVAGCVPILKDSRILLIRSSGGNGWLIPKGGWEDDENLEECAIRESYEESGVLGVLGLKVGTYKVETRKARAVRLEGDKDATCSAAWIVEPCNLASLLPTTHLVKPDEHVSGKLPHSHVCMSFFPLYVHTVKSAWPESHRRRRAFTIDEAINVIRPEFQPILGEVKQLGLHLVGKYLQDET